MQWDDTPNAGFTTAEARPWLPLAADYATRNVAAQEDDPASMLSLFRALTALRRAEPALNRGGIELVDVPTPGVLAYRRTHEEGDSFLVLLNFGDESHPFNLDALDPEGTEIILSTDPTRTIGAVAGAVSLAGNEGVILRLSRREG